MYSVTQIINKKYAVIYSFETEKINYYSFCNSFKFANGLKILVSAFAGDKRPVPKIDPVLICIMLLQLSS